MGGGRGRVSLLDKLCMLNTVLREATKKRKVAGVEKRKLVTSSCSDILHRWNHLSAFSFKSSRE